MIITDEKSRAITLKIGVMITLMLILAGSNYLATTYWYGFTNCAIAIITLAFGVLCIVRGNTKGKIIGVFLLIVCIFSVKEVVEYTIAEEKEVSVKVLDIEYHRVKNSADYLKLWTSNGKSYNVVYKDEIEKIKFYKERYINKECLISYKELSKKNVALKVDVKHTEK